MLQELKHKDNAIDNPLVAEMRKNFDLAKLDDFIKNPLSSVPLDRAGRKGSLKFDKRVFRKLCQGIYVLAFQNMDINILEDGTEGSGKTTDASQIGYVIYWLMCELNVLNKDLGLWYEWNLKNVMGYNLDHFLELYDKFTDMPFRIIICDEASGLQAERRWEEANIKARDDWRKDRKRLTIRIVIHPQAWELVRDLTQARINMIRINKMTSAKRGYNKDDVDVIILPRGDYTYSYHTGEIIHQNEMKVMMKERAKEKYTGVIPKKYIYCTSKKTGIFTFDPIEYERESKRMNKNVKRKDIKITKHVAYILAKYLSPDKLGLSRNVPEGLDPIEREHAEKEKKYAMSLYDLKKKCQNLIKKISQK